MPLWFSFPCCLWWQDDVLISGDISSDDGAAGASSPPHPVSGPVPNQGTPVGSSSLATAVPSLPVPLELATAPVARAVSSGNDGANEVRRTALAGLKLYC